MARPNVRQQLVEAGLDTMHLHGFNGCGVQDITTAAGVPKGSFYNHFESKDALAQFSLETYWERGAERRRILQDLSVEPVERLRRYFQSLSDYIRGNQYLYGCLIGNFSTELSAHNDTIRNQLRQLFKQWTLEVEACVREAMDSGSINPTLKVHDVAAFLVNSWEGAVLRSKVERDDTPLIAFLTVAFATIFND
ncbi:TetR family transcriptional regulator C-terminal domain-containing protein [Caballeronia sp. NCTM5]|uniref:TetR family transcriptional regulator C-terminal domain-containing protein n=1 Tax=Caballeronia sp. NCTM5 TaxID=2921755 RepID=UPI0020284A6C|nr:TetR family transcriptional regulator C-terminal domain-containing protein [Caballeronia sp. NCTM5]